MRSGRGVRVGAVLALIVGWEAVARLGWVSPIILAAPSEVIEALIADRDRFAGALMVTAAEIAAATLAVVFLGVGSGLVAGGLRPLGAVVGPLLSWGFAVPAIVLYPLCIAWLGLGWGSKIAFGIVSGFFPVALSTLYGLRQIDPRYRLMATAMGAGPIQIHAKVLAPLALPSIVSGLRIGTGLVVIGVVVAEMLASLRGVGYMISYHRTLFDTGHVYAGILLTLVLVLVINRTLCALERRVGGWRTWERLSR